MNNNNNKNQAPKRSALGRGLGALLDDSDSIKPNAAPAEVVTTVTVINNIDEIPIGSIETNPYQPRTNFDEEALNELAESIKVQGIIQPITVRKLDSDTYQLISGERRFQASKRAGLEKIPAYIRTANDQQMLEMALIENIQRENLNAIEVALSFQRMLDECNLKQEELGDRVSKNRSTVTNYLRLLKLPPSIQASIRDGDLTMGHARALVTVEDADKQLYIHQAIVSQGLSVRKVEEMVRDLQKINLKKPSAKAPVMSFQYQKLQDDLGSKFGTKVKLKVQGKGKGSIEIPFLSEEDLSRILELLDW